MSGKFLWVGSGEGMLVFFESIDINSMFIEMSQLTHLDKRAL